MMYEFANLGFEKPFSAVAREVLCPSSGSVRSKIVEQFGKCGDPGIYAVGRKPRVSERVRLIQHTGGVGLHFLGPHTQIRDL
jgi:hypothetical protein